MMNDKEHTLFAQNLILKVPPITNDGQNKKIIILPVKPEIRSKDFLSRLSYSMASLDLSRDKFLHKNALALESQKHHFQWPNGETFKIPEDGLDAYLGIGLGTGARYVTDVKSYSSKKRPVLQLPQERILERLRAFSLFFSVFDYETYYWIVKGDDPSEPEIETNEIFTPTESNNEATERILP